MRRSRFSRRKNKNKFKSFSKFLIIFFLMTGAALLVMPNPSYNDCFRSLQELQNYAAHTNENTPMENNDTLRPEFTNYYKSLKPNFYKRLENKIIWILSKLNLAAKPVWDVTAFNSVLVDLTTLREKAGQKDNFVCRIQTAPNSKFAVFGNLQGSFHSMVRCLGKLKELGFIDETLKITQPQNYMIFMGGVVDRSPFTLETLTAVMKLVQLNPNNVIYIRGSHELNNYWQEHTLKTELQLRAATLSKQAIPLEKEVNTFFNTLPLATYLSVPASPTDFIRISHFGRSELASLNENNFADILTKKTDAGFTYFAVKEKPETPDAKINIKIILRGEKKRSTFQKMEGLRLLAPDMDSVAWNILSCPNVVYQRALDFFYDSFVIISAAEQLFDWQITLYNHDLRTTNPFNETTFNFISGLDVKTHKQKMEDRPPQATPQPQTLQPVPILQPTTTAATPTQQSAPQTPVQSTTQKEQTALQSQPPTQVKIQEPARQQATQPHISALPALPDASLSQPAPVAQPQVPAQTTLLQEIPPTPEEVQEQQKITEQPKEVQPVQPIQSGA